MVVSAAFAELTKVLEQLESADAEVEAVEVGERLGEAGEEITAELTVSVPLLTGIADEDDVAIKAENFDLEEGRIDVDFTVSLPANDATGRGSPRVDASAVPDGDSAVPSYKDPDALRAVYEECDTFPEMTDALDADVTSETVRRYMVEYDIHDPHDSRPQAYKRATSSDPADRDADGPEPGANDDGSGNDPADSEGDTDGKTATTGATGSVQDDDSNVKSAADAAEQSGEACGDPGDQSVVDLIADTDGGRTDSVVADGVGIPRDLTVAELTTIVNESNTLYQARRRLDLSQDRTRRLLREFDLIDLVTRRLGAEQIDASPAEVERRIRGTDPSQ